MRDVEKLIAGANAAMREKLEENSHKPGWEKISIQELLRLSDTETVELKMAVYIFEHQLCDRYEAIREVRREAADRINFDAMLIQKCDKIISESGAR